MKFDTIEDWLAADPDRECGAQATADGKFVGEVIDAGGGTTGVPCRDVDTAIWSALRAWCEIQENEP